jgi:hypothetical protein
MVEACSATEWRPSRRSASHAYGVDQRAQILKNLVLVEADFADRHV